MKYINEEKYYSIYEISKASNISRKEILELEKEKIILPSFKDKTTSYRYYDPLIIFKLNEVKLLLNASFSYEDIRRYYSSTLNKEEKLSFLKEKEKAISTSISLLSNVNTIKKIKLDPIIYYYEERNLLSYNRMIISLIKEIYIHALNKDYLIDISSLPFILFNKDKLSNNNLSPFKVKICIPLLKDYKEKNISILSFKEGIEFSSSTSSFEKNLLIFNLSLLKNNIIINDEVYMNIFLSNLNLHNFIAFNKENS